MALLGTFGASAAIFSIGGGPPRTVKVGQSVGGVTLVSVEQEQATIEVEGKRRVLSAARSTTAPAAARPAARPAPTREGDARGRLGRAFLRRGQINGGAIRFVVDTGATSIAIPASDAARLGIDYQKGRRVSTQTAAGPTPAYLVSLSTVRIGDIELHNVAAIVIEQGLNIALLGNSFLSRTEMRLEGQTMTLTRRY